MSKADIRLTGRVNERHQLGGHLTLRRERQRHSKRIAKYRRSGCASRSCSKMPATSSSKSFPDDIVKRYGTREAAHVTCENFRWMDDAKYADGTLSGRILRLTSWSTPVYAGPKTASEVTDLKCQQLVQCDLLSADPLEKTGLPNASKYIPQPQDTWSQS